MVNDTVYRNISGHIHYNSFYPTLDNLGLAIDDNACVIIHNGRKM